jgi:hypothetical protein
MQEPNQSLNNNLIHLQEVCSKFLQSTYYRKAMSDASYERMQAIKDFLRAQVVLPMRSLNADQLEEMALDVRKNYYRYF